MKEQLRKELQQALKNRDTLRAETLRMMIAELTVKEKEHGTTVTEEEAFKVLFSMLRKREDAIQQFRKGNREDLAQKEQAEIEIINEYLPKQMSEDEIRREARAVIAEVGATGIKEMGKVMGVLSKKLAGKAPGSLMSKIVTEELTTQ